MAWIGVSCLSCKLIERQVDKVINNAMNNAKHKLHDFLPKSKVKISVPHITHSLFISNISYTPRYHDDISLKQP